MSVIQESDMKESVQALSQITERLRKGSTISEVQTAFEAHEFPALERKTSQMALLAAVERSSKEVVNVQDIITQVRILEWLGWFLKIWSPVELSRNWDD